MNCCPRLTIRCAATTTTTVITTIRRSAARCLSIQSAQLHASPYCVYGSTNDTRHRTASNGSAMMPSTFISSTATSTTTPATMKYRYGTTSIMYPIQEQCRYQQIGSRSSTISSLLLSSSPSSSSLISKLYLLSTTNVRKISTTITTASSAATTATTSTRSTNQDRSVNTKNKATTANGKKPITKKLSKKQLIANALEREYKDIYHKDTTVHIKLCYTDHDIQEGDIIKAKFHYETIIALLEEEFGKSVSSEVGSNDAVEYYNPKKEEWKPFVPYRLYEVLQYYKCTSKQPLPLRIPSLYDEEYGTRNDVVKLRKITPKMRQAQLQMIMSGPSQHQWLLKEIIDAIIQKLKGDGYTRAATSSLQHPKLTFQYHDEKGSIQHITQSTKQYVLDLAKLCPWTMPSAEEEAAYEQERMEQQGIQERPGTRANPLGVHNAHKMAPDYNRTLLKLKHVLLSQPRALSHICECIHYDYLWD